ncbi:hypothetical protein [Microseira wollei]|nr:hypothetical protein [Microseira wollei]
MQLQRLATPCPGRGSQESGGAAAAPCYAVPLLNNWKGRDRRKFPSQ